jgi:integrase
LTFVATRLDGKRKSPNPNVLVEHGWALESLGYYRVLGVINTAYGEPSDENMPFDMKHLRKPIPYHLPPGSVPDVKQKARERLTKDLRYAIETVFVDEDFVAALPKPPPPPKFPEVQPMPGRNRFYLYSDEEVQRLLAETLKHRVGATSISRWVRYTLYGLLSVTGLRIGEALRLNLADVDLDQGILTIRDSKFGKSRLVPVHTSTRIALGKYLQRRNDYFDGRNIEPLFVSRHGTRMRHNDARKSLVRLSRKIGLRGPSDRRGPRLHDFRHRVAVLAMLRCYRSGADPERRLPALSTYLGHGDLKHTYWYLHQNPALMRQAVGRLERYWEVR